MTARAGFTIARGVPSSETSLQLPLTQRLKLIRQRIYAALGVGGEVVVRLEKTPEGLFAVAEGQRIRIPSPLRWKLYRKGWRARLDRLEAEYGVPRHAGLGANSLVLDIGANAGEFAHVCARYGAKVICFEPDPLVFECLKTNIAALSNARAEEIVIWKEDGEIDFGLAPERADSSVFAQSASRIKKRAITIASYLREHSIDRVDLVKCDAEGAEPEVLEGARGAFDKIAAFALDTGAERMGERTNEACAAILSAAGYRIIEEKVGTRLMTYAVCG